MKRLLLVGFSLIGVGWAAWASQEDKGETRNPAAVRLPHQFGAIQPRISPDGHNIVCSYHGAIWRIPRVGGLLTRLTDGTGYDIEPAWSPDGRRIAYVNAPRMSGGEIRLIDAESGKNIPIPGAPQAIDTTAYAKIAFHPDGRLLGCLRVNGKEAGIALLNLATGEAQTVATPIRQSRFALSNDGKWLVSTVSMDVAGQQWGNDGSQTEIWKVAVAGGEPSLVTKFPSRVHDVAWSADDTALYLVTELGGVHFDVWRMPLADPERGARQVTTGQADEDRPSFSADGRWMLYSDNRDQCTSLVVRDLETGIETLVEASRLDFRSPTARIRIVTVDKEGDRPVTARVSLQQLDGKYYAPPASLHRVLDDVGHFYCASSAEFTVPAGKYHARAIHGPEYRAAHLDLSVEPGQKREVKLVLERWTNPGARGWHSGENHIHANYGYGQWYNTPETMLLQCAGEDLRVCNFMVANSDTNGVFDREFFRGRADPVSTAETILYWNQEFRSTHWGHMTLVNLNHVVEPVFTGFKDTTNPWDIPTNTDLADRAHLQKGALVNYTHGAQNPDDPYAGAYTGKSIPMDVALGRIDTIDLNASYAGTIPLWYRLLNCGFKLPPSAGTDCFLNRIRSRLPGADRAYVHIDGEFSYSAWIEGLRAGRSFISSGPMLELAIDGKGPGETVRLGTVGKVRVVAKASSQFPLNRVELVRNGKVVSTAALSDDKLSGAIDQEIEIPQSGWLSFRAAGLVHPDHSGGPLEAHMAPIYVEVAGRPTSSRDDASYFVQWIDRLALATRVRDRIPSAELKKHVERQLEEARNIYVRMAATSE